MNPNHTTSQYTARGVHSSLSIVAPLSGELLGASSKGTALQNNPSEQTISIKSQTPLNMSDSDSSDDSLFAEQEKGEGKEATKGLRDVGDDVDSMKRLDDSCLCLVLGVDCQTSPEAGLNVPLGNPNQKENQGTRSDPEIKGIRCLKCNLHKPIVDLPADTEIPTYRRTYWETFWLKYTTSRSYFKQTMVDPCLGDPCCWLIMGLNIFCWFPRCR